MIFSKKIGNKEALLFQMNLVMNTILMLLMLKIMEKLKEH